MKLTDVSTSKRIVNVDSYFLIAFKIVGEEPAGFMFPFSNESLVKNEIEFTKKGD